MSQFSGYTLELVLKDQTHTTIKGVIKQIIEKNVVVSNAMYLDGTPFKEGSKDVHISGGDIKDLRVIGLPVKKGMKKEKKKKKKRTERNAISETPEEDTIIKYSQNGSTEDWDGESARKVKQMDDFDFEGNLEKFDKASVFREISQQDDVNPEERLVSFNKLDPEHQKYGNDEMVLEKHQDQWDIIDENDYKQKQAQPVRRKEQVERNEPRRSSTPVLDLQFTLATSDGKAVPTCSPLQLAEIELSAANKFHFARPLLVENSARGIADLVIRKVFGNFRVGASNHNTPPLMLALAGNNRAGAIALATGRQLFNHGVRVVTFLLYDYDNSEEELDDLVSSNLETFTATGGKVVTKAAELEALLSKLDSPLEFVLDGLQGYDTDLNDLIEPERSVAKGLVDWTNSHDLPVMSIDIPSGLNASSGSSDFPSFLAAKYLISIGLPLSSILNIYKFGYFQKTQLTQFAVDNGVPRKVFTSKSSLRKFDGFWSTGSWTFELELM